MIQRTISDLIISLKNELTFLRDFCESYDNGNEIYAKKIALSLRVLLHDTRKSKSILSQLNVKETIQFFDSALPYNERNLSTTSCLTFITISPNFDKAVPLKNKGPLKDQTKYKNFEDWWHQIVLDDKSAKFSRKDIVLSVSDTDGGAHVDPELIENYHDLTREHSMNWRVCKNGMEKPIEDFCLASIRQIGFEVEKTLNEMRIDLWQS